MPTELGESTHRLAAVLFTDMQGYSRQMALDERATLARLEAHNALLREQIQRHGGRLVKTIGDAFMVEFLSSVTAVRCALEIQRSVARWNALQPESEQFRIRAGVHVGDVHVRGDDLFGEAVNVAARIEPCAPAGEVCVSRPVLEQVLRKVNATATSLGRRRLKNIPERLSLYSLTPADERLEAMPIRRRISPRRAGLALAGLLVVAGIAFALTRLSRSGRPVHGGTLRVALPLDRGNFSLYTRFAGAGSTAMGEVLDPLVAWNVDGVPREVAAKVRTSPDGRTVTLELKPNLRFHDHPCLPHGKGRAADAKDLAYSLLSALREDGAGLDLAGDDPAHPERAPEGLRVTGERTVELKLSKPNQFAADALTDIWLVPRELEGCESLADLRQPVGTGPFRFAGAPGEELTVSRAEQWSEAGPERLPYLDGVRLATRADPESALSALARGELDVVVLSLTEAHRFLEFDPQGHPHLAARFGALDATVAPNFLGGFSLGAIFPLHHPGSALATPEVRRALSYALDRATISTAFAVPKATPFGALLDSTMLGVDPALRPMGEDLAEAERILRAAGHPHGQGLPEITLAHAPARAAAAQAISAQAARVGLRVRPVELSLSAISDAASHQSVDAYLGFNYYGVHGAEPSGFLDSLVRHGEGWGYPVEGGSELLTDGMSNPDRTARAQVWRTLAGKLLAAQSVIPLSKTRETVDTFAAYWVISSRVHGLYDPIAGRLRIADHRFAQVWLSP